jgi:hypothetical protein
MRKTNIYPNSRSLLRWILPCFFVLTTCLLLSQAPRHNHCLEVAPGNDACIPLPELLALLISGPSLRIDRSLQYEYLPSEYFVGMLVGVFVFWFWIGWRLEGSLATTPTPDAPPRTWLPLVSYAPWIFIAAARTYATVRHDRVNMAYVLAALQHTGILAQLQAAGKIWIERAQGAWLLVLVISFLKEIWPIINGVSDARPLAPAPLPAQTGEGATEPCRVLT